MDRPALTYDDLPDRRPTELLTWSALWAATIAALALARIDLAIAPLIDSTVATTSESAGRALACLLGVSIFIGLALTARTVGSFGFPDGHKTELELAYLRMWEILRVPGALIGVYFVVIGLVARGRHAAVVLWISIALMAVALVGVWCECADLARYLDDGRGG